MLVILIILTIHNKIFSFLTFYFYNLGNKRKAHCSFWDTKLKPSGAWSSEGCEMTDTNETHTECCCYHLTSFAVMMEQLEEEVVDTTTQKISYLTYGCIGLSMLSLIVFSFLIICSKYVL